MRARQDLLFGPLPVDLINKTLGLELEPGEVVLSRGAQFHAHKRHPDVYNQCLPHVAQVVVSPLYLGDDFRNENSIEMVCRIPAMGAGLLVAISVELTNDGYYHVKSFYPVSEIKIENRRNKGHLKIVVKV